MDEVAALTGKAFTIVNIATVSVFCGAMLGAMLVFLFSSYAIRAVGQNVQYVIMDVRRQFKNPGILSSTSVCPSRTAHLPFTCTG
jgi:K(+)-stimulated pyrophosphate-energized sodium pump